MTLRVVPRAWGQMLGVQPEAFERDGIHLVARDHDAVVVVELGGGCVVAGPSGILETLSRADRPVLGDADALAALLGGPSIAVAVGTADLWFAHRPVGADGSGTAEATEADLAALRNDCTFEEFDESGVGELRRAWTIRTETGEIAAMAGYTPWAHTLAHMGVLSARSHRGEGLAYRAAARAVDAALDEGLLPQWRCRVGNEPSARLARRLGFTRAGRQTAVRLTNRAR